VEHRRQTARQARHSARTTLHTLALDPDAIEDADLRCPEGVHDLARKTSPRVKDGPKPGRRRGFKVWKSPFWKRRRKLWAQRNAAERRIADAD